VSEGGLQNQGLRLAGARPGRVRKTRSHFCRCIAEPAGNLQAPQIMHSTRMIVYGMLLCMILCMPTPVPQQRVECPKQRETVHPLCHWTAAP
jgi:hypothetical protein